MLCNPLPNNKLSDVTKLKAFADDKLKGAKMTIFLYVRAENTVGKGFFSMWEKIFLYDRAENTVGKGENAGYQHFLLFPQCFPSLLIKGH